MVPRTGIEPARISPHAPQTCASTNSATWARQNLFKKNYLLAFVLASVFAAVFAGAFETTLVFDVEFSGAFAAVFVAVFAAVFVSVVETGAVVSVVSVVCKTEIFPVIAGIAKSRAEIKKTAAAAMVIFDKMVVVPRGPKAVLEMLLVNNAPASVLPGCSKTAITSTMHEIKNNA